MKQYTAKDIEAMVNAFQKGEVLAFPTDTVYGVGVRYGNKKALERLKAMKHRDQNKPIPMMCSNLEQVKSLIEPLSPMALAIAQAFLPGPLTLIVALKPDVDRFYTNGKDTIALRIPNAPVLLSILDGLDAPLMVSSANVSGQPAALNQEQAKAMLPDLDGILDGECKEMQASTIVDCTQDTPKILREGPISLVQIQEAISKAWGLPFFFDIFSKNH